MSAQFAYRTYKTKGDANSIREKLTFMLVGKGYILEGSSYTTRYFKYPSLLFSTKKPLTCISLLSLEVIERNGGSIVKIGVTFTKIRYFTIFIMLMFCIIIPAILGIMQHGVPDVPPMAVLGIPLGFMVHYHVRGRVFRTLGRLIENAGGIK